MKTTIQYNIRRNDPFYHPDCPVLYRQHDTIGNLADCPFPLETDAFKVLLFGSSKENGGTNGGYGNKFAVVEYKKSCGHTVQERIPFIEGIKDFEHYGTKYTGASYSIKDWKNRIEFFRTCLPCDVCQTVKHSIWSRNNDDSLKSEKKRIEQLTHLLDYNFTNWRELVDVHGNSK